MNLDVEKSGDRWKPKSNPPVILRRSGCSLLYRLESGIHQPPDITDDGIPDLKSN